ncbi:hypothetical protein AFLA_000887 [Aspergillus flavus NRRL3357]|nr:hypothetical protein AFLA_000887 [Aspergillus flavus NRRL3357]
MWLDLLTRTAVKGLHKLGIPSTDLSTLDFSHNAALVIPDSSSGTSLKFFLDLLTQAGRIQAEMGETG